MIFLGIDNGVSGSLGIVRPSAIGRTQYLHTPVKRELNYTKTKKWLHRIDYAKLYSILESINQEATVFLERPMVNPGRFQATVSALRALEATLIVIEELKLPYEYVDSKQWQKELLPSGLKGEELKEASLQVAKRLFPKVNFKGFSDGDGLLIGEYGRRKYNKQEVNKEN